MAFNFYDLTNNTALSAKELFSFRTKRDTTVPSRGGQKEFEPDPDVTWMQAKNLEAFIQEWTSIINEPRVEKVRNLVHGTWDDKSKLVNVDKPGKFWAQMGFTDKQKNWLYPEEALFLLEVNSLEVYKMGVSMSVQEAYDIFLGDQITLPQYQVFAHLRRLGYVVLRHESTNVITDYERKINLNKYIDKKTLKERKLKAKALMGNNDEECLVVEELSNSIDDTSENDSIVILSCQSVSDSEFAKTKNLETDKSEALLGNVNVNNLESKRNDLESSNDQACIGDDTNIKNSENVSNTTEEKATKRNRDKDSEEEESANVKKQCTDNESDAQDNTDTEKSLSPSRKFYPNDWSKCFSRQKTVYKEGRPCLRQTSWTDIDLFPDIGGTEFLQLVKPEKKLLPTEIDVLDDVLRFDVLDYREKVPEKYLTKNQQREEEDEQRVEGLDFSFAEWTRRKFVVKSSNWSEHKSATAAYWQETATPVSHLWRDDVTPLVSPSDAWTTGSILKKLDIIKAADEKDLKVNKATVKNLPLSYDVYLPDKCFKKSNPGKPDHRVLVTKVAGHPPELSHMMALSQTDGVPVHWAVVDCGEIAFFNFNTSHKLDTLT